MEKERKCLKCQKMFWSYGSGNRICDKCKGGKSTKPPPISGVAMNERLRQKVGSERWDPNDRILMPDWKKGKKR